AGTVVLERAVIEMGAEIGEGGDHQLRCGRDPGRCSGRGRYERRFLRGHPPLLPQWSPQAAACVSPIGAAFWSRQAMVGVAAALGVEGMTGRAIKRFIDIIACLVALPLVLAVSIFIALGVHLMMGRPVLFRQKRAGLDGRIFELWKFRTMTDERDEAGRLLPDEMRLTWLGKLLRSTSLDELPQVWNVIKGDMSVVGPRPLLPEYLDRYTPEQA